MSVLCVLVSILIIILLKSGSDVRIGLAFVSISTCIFKSLKYLYTTQKHFSKDWQQPCLRHHMFKHFAFKACLLNVHWIVLLLPDQMFYESVLEWMDEWIEGLFQIHLSKKKDNNKYK